MTQKNSSHLATTTDISRSSTPLGAKVARGALVLLALLAASVSLLPGGRAIYRAVLLGPSVVATSQSAPLVASGGDVTHTSITLAGKAGMVYLDVFAPNDPVPLVPGARPGVILIPGVGDNRTTPPLVNLDEALARAGYVAMNFTTQSLIDFTLAPADSDSLLQAVLRLEQWPGVAPSRVGILGLSAGGALACLAEVDPRLQGKLAYLVLFGTYFNAADVLRDVGMRGQDVNGSVVPWNPDPVAIFVLADSVLPTLPAADAALIKQSLGYNPPRKIHPLSAQQIATLSPGAAAVYHLLLGDQPDRVQENIDVLPTAAQTLLTALSPSSVVGQMHTPTYLLYSTDDAFIPYTQSLAFNTALTSLGRPRDIVELSIFSHVEVNNSAGLGALLGDVPNLLSILYQLLLPAS